MINCGGETAAANQNYTLERQLADGVRMLQVEFVFLFSERGGY